MSSFSERTVRVSGGTHGERDYTSLLRRASEPSRVLNRFARDLLVAAAAQRPDEHGLWSDPEFGFAVHQLLVPRMRALQRFLVPESVDAEALADFLDCTLEMARPELAAAETADDLAEAFVASLDALHGYVEAHGLVADAYVAGERRSLARATHEAAAGAASAEIDSPLEQNAAKNDLALAA